MLRPLFWLGLLALWSSSFNQGCQDARKALTHLTYYPTRDMRQTIALDPQRSTWGAPDSLSVPTIGRDAYVNDTAPYDVASKLLTAPATSEPSEARGDSLFHTICWTCHGRTMAGDGPVSAKFIPPPDLLGESTRGKSDGFMYMYMRHGGAVMPSYGNAISSRDAWDLVHYIRHMQKVSPR